MYLPVFSLWISPCLFTLLKYHFISSIFLIGKVASSKLFALLLAVLGQVSRNKASKV